MEENRINESNVNAKVIIFEVLKALNMNAPSLANATGISYQRIFDLQRGRTKKFNPNVVNAICASFPQINKAYLYTGEGNVLNGESYESPTEGIKEKTEQLSELLKKIVTVQQYIYEKDKILADKDLLLSKREEELNKREALILQKELELMNKKAL